MTSFNWQKNSEKDPNLLESPYDGLSESGYFSFQGAHSLHNSTAQTSLLVEVATNATDYARNVRERQSISDNFRRSYSVDHGSSSIVLQNVTTPNGSTFDSENFISPHPEQYHSATKRRKHHFQHHSSPKKSKKKLNFVEESDNAFAQRRYYYNGVDRLDIIGMLDTYPMLETIFGSLSTRTLEIMTQVSLQWQRIIYNSKRSAERLYLYHIKLNLTKENKQILCSSKSRINTTTNLPLHQSNGLQTQHQYALPAPQDLSADMQKCERCVKCPRCGKSSQVHNKPTKHIPSTCHKLSRTMSSIGSLDCTSTTSTCVRPPISRFYSVDDNSEELSFAECQSAICQFKFCLNCFCEYHPDKKCLITELGTPSKIHLPFDRTSPKRIHKHDSKLSRKKSLKRLCF